MFSFDLTICMIGPDWADCAQGGRNYLQRPLLGASIKLSVFPGLKDETWGIWRPVMIPGSVGANCGWDVVACRLLQRWLRSRLPL